MKPTTLKDFRIPARNIAELRWGRGGTTAYRTNRRGAYYHSCSGHGGYVVDSRCLTEAERVEIDKHIKPEPLRLLVQHRDGTGDVVIGVDCVYFQSIGPYKQKSYRYIPRLGEVEWQDLSVYLFEEDCDWAVLEKLTDIRADLKWTTPMTESRRQAFINETFSRWHNGSKATLG